MIRAPFNFIPIPSKVVYPSWGKLISHDIPFSDGLSGRIKIKLTALSSIFVRNGHNRAEGEEQSGNYLSFSRTGADGGFFIPATSMKGMVRSIVEIISFGKMRIDPTVKYALRDWVNNRDIYPIIDPKEQNKIHCGWLRPVGDGENEEYEIVDCGKPRRVAQTGIDKHLGYNYFFQNFSEFAPDINKERESGGEKCDPKTAEFKYRMIPSLKSLRKVSFSPKPDSDKVVRIDPNGELVGTMVFTGQPNVWKNRTFKPVKNPDENLNDRKSRSKGKPDGKFFEFVFLDRENKKSYKVSQEEFQQYKSIYKDSPDWKYLCDTMLETTGIPVFFRPDPDDKNKILDWGLTFLYKLPYKRTPFEAYSHFHPGESKFRPDMAECIFGYTEVDKGRSKDDDGTSLKGRVQFTPFRALKAEEEREITLVLAGPKPSYFPMYIDQGNGDGKGHVATYKTYNDGDLKGWKRYVRRKNTWEKRMNEKKIDTVLKPLKAGAEFEGYVMFHNLRPEELGALLSAITFHGNADTACHQIGMAKPYGYGQVSVSLEGMYVESVGDELLTVYQEANPYMAIFEKYMDNQLGANFWRDTPTIRELMTMATREVSDNGKFDYMSLDMNGNNEFIEAKGGESKSSSAKKMESDSQSKKPKEFLQYFTDIVGYKRLIPSLTGSHKEAIASHANHPKELKDRLEKAEKEAQKILREKQEADEEAKKQAAEEAAIESMLKAGLRAVLEEKFTSGPNIDKYKVTTFTDGIEKTDKWIKNIGQTVLPESEFEALAQFIIRMADAAAAPDVSKSKGKRNKKGKEKPSPLKDRTHKNWQSIEKWTSKDFVDNLFNEINPS